MERKGKSKELYIHYYIHQRQRERIAQRKPQSSNDSSFPQRGGVSQAKTRDESNLESESIRESHFHNTGRKRKRACVGRPESAKTQTTKRPEARNMYDPMYRRKKTPVRTTTRPHAAHTHTTRFFEKGSRMIQGREGKKGCIKGGIKSIICRLVD